MSSSTSRLASSMSASWPVSFHQPLDPVALDPVAAVDQPLDRVGDLELAAPGGLDRPRGLEDRRAEHVDADERQVAGRVLRLLDQAHDPVAVELGDAVVLGSGTRVSRIRASGSSVRKASTRSLMPSRSRLSPRYITNGPVLEELLGGEHRVGEARAARPAGCR